MDSGLYAAVNGALRAELRMEVLANNLANVNTNGYKEDNITFDSYMTEPGPEQFPLPTDSFLGQRTPGGIPFPFSNPSANAYQMTYPRADGTTVDLSQGAMQKTGNRLDVALEGEGFFVVNTPDGPRYTRDGHFQVNTLGELVNKNGHPVQGAGGANLVIGDNPVEIGADGVISGPGGNLGQIQVVGLPEEALTKVGQNLYSAPAGAEVALEDSSQSFHQGFLEGSNSNMIRGMTQMIETGRAMEAYMRLIKTMDQLDAQAAGQIGKLE
ncbi:MAG: flagellar basal-body rod protein FlgF [Magnetococcales bacterium]|nr:flagellar basal-body rod protein FlgF [Magnetococcales bacterium]